MKDRKRLYTKIAKKYGATFCGYHEDCPVDAGASAGRDIYLGKFDDPDIELIAFFHELGHACRKNLLKTIYSLSTLSNEGFAWEYGLHLAMLEGFSWEFESKEMEWARGRLRTYIHCEGDGTEECDRATQDSNREVTYG